MEQQPKKQFNWKLLAIVLGIITIIIYIDSCNKIKQVEKEHTAFVEALNDTITVYKNREGNLVTSISVLASNNAKEFYQLNIKDSTIQHLQDVVKDYKNKLKAGSSVTTVTSESSIKNTNPTIVVPPKEPLPLNSIPIYPTYRDTMSNQWVKYSIEMNKDSSKITIKFSNRYDIVIGSDKGKPFADIINYNPYDTVKTLRTYQITLPKPKKWGVGISGGAALGTNFKFTPYIGVGINYNIIRF